jgi:hypothetical protein
MKSTIELTKFAWEMPGDAIKQWDLFYRQFKTTLAKKNIAYIMNEEATNRKRLPIPEEADVGEILKLEGTALTRWNINAKSIHDLRVLGLAAEKNINEDFETGQAVLEDSFEINCNARIHMANCVPDEEDSSESLFKGTFMALETDYKPNKTSNVIELKQDLKMWTDKGIKFTVYHAEFKRLLGELTSMDARPDDNDLNVMVADALTNPKLTRLVENLVMHTHQPDDYPGHSWDATLEEANILCRKFPAYNCGAETIKASQATLKKNPGSQQQTKEGAGKGSGGGGARVCPRSTRCWRCDQSGHRVADCAATKCYRCGNRWAGSERHDCPEFHRGGDGTTNKRKADPKSSSGGDVKKLKSTTSDEGVTK